MPFRNAFRKVKKYFKKKYYGKKKTYPRSYKGKQFRAHHFKLPISFGNKMGDPSPSNPSITNYTNINLSSISDYQSYANLFDQYRLNKIVLIFTPLDVQATAGLSSGTVNSRGHLSYVINRTGDNITTESQMQEYSNYKEIPYGKQVKVSFVPNCLGMAYKTSIATAYMPKYKQWIDTADIGAYHYGISYNVQTEDSQFIPEYKVRGYMYFSTKNCH